jgi:propionyl-CoA carboxylase beta chain
MAEDDRPDPAPLDRLDAMNRRALEAGGPRRIQKQHDAGKLTARERIELLLDPGTFVEIDASWSTTSAGLRDGREQDPRRRRRHRPRPRRRPEGLRLRPGLHRLRRQPQRRLRAKICKIMDLADEGRRSGDRPQRLRRRSHPGGRREPRRLRRHLPAEHLASGVVPQISAILGPCAGGAVYSPAITDFIFMVEGSSYMFITGPDVIKTVTHEEVTKEELGGARTHNAQERRRRTSRRRRRRTASPRSGSCSPTCRSTTRGAPADREPLRGPRDRRGARARLARPRGPEEALRHARRSSTHVVDDGDFLEVHAAYARTSSSASRGSAAARRHRRQPAAGAGRLPRHRRLGEGRALRPLLRRVQHPARHPRGRPGLPARHRPGVRRDHQARRQAALRLLRGHGPEAHA